MSVRGVTGSSRKLSYFGIRIVKVDRSMWFSLNSWISMHFYPKEEVLEYTFLWNKSTLYTGNSQSITWCVYHRFRGVCVTLLMECASV